MNWITNDAVNYSGASLYGNFRTRTFADIFPEFEAFKKDYSDNGIPGTISTTNLETLYYLLYARYGNSNIASSDENQFRYKVFSTIFMYGPAWQKRLEIQQKLIGLDLNSEDLNWSIGTAIYNNALNPSAMPTTQTTSELNYINSQNVTKHKKSKLDAYANLYALIETDVTAEFLEHFKKFFITIVEPDYPLWYTTIEGE